MTSSTTIAKSGTGSTGPGNRLGHFLPRIGGFFPILHWLLASWLLQAGFFESLCAANAAPAGATSGVSHRHLFIVETSRTMQRREAGVQEVLKELLRSGMQGQLKTGDTIGLWTFAEELYAGEFPLQHWKSEDSGKITGSILGFLGSKTNDGPAKLELIVSPLQQLVQQSEFLTVILITSGEQYLNGTPFDEQVNTTFRLWESRQQRSQMPITTIFRTVRSKTVGLTVTPAPWPVELPPLPPELLSRPAAPKQPVTASPKTSPPPSAPKQTGPALVFSGSNPEPAASPQALVFSGSDPNPVSQTPTRSAVSPVSKPAEPTPSLSQAASEAAALPANATVTPTAQSAASPVAKPAEPTPALSQAASESEPSLATTTVAPTARSAVSPVAKAAEPAPVTAVEPEPSSEPTTTAVIPARASVWGPRSIGIISTGAAFSLLLLLFRRPREPRGSLITRSMHPTSGPGE